MPVSHFDPIAAIAPLTVDVLGFSITEGQVALAGAIVLLLLLGLSAFFSSSEIAMFALPPHRVETVVEEQRPGSGTLKRLKDDPHRTLVTILVGNNLVNIAMSSIATGLLAFFLASQSLAVLIATFGVTALVLLFGESAPKSYAVDNTESWALRVARPLRYAELLLLPLIVLFDYLTRLVNSVTGGQGAIESTYVSRDEIQAIIETGEREGVIEEDEREMIQRTLRFNRTIAKEVMTPRLDINAASTDETIEEAIQICVQHNHSRLPVYEGELDNIIGVVQLTDLVREIKYGEGGSPSVLTDITKETLHVPETKNVNELLREMRDMRLNMAVVIDEFGTTEGLVTMEDLSEEIVGEILEGGEDVPIKHLDDGSAIVKGEVNIDAINDALEIELPEGEEFETIAGFIFNRVGRLVDAGEVIEHEGLEIRVEQVDNTRIMKARIDNIDRYQERQTVSEDEIEADETG